MSHSVHFGPSPILGASTYLGCRNPYRATQFTIPGENPYRVSLRRQRLTNPVWALAWIRYPGSKWAVRSTERPPWVLGSPASTRNFNPIKSYPNCLPTQFQPYPKPLLESKSHFPPQIFPKNSGPVQTYPKPPRRVPPWLGSTPVLTILPWSFLVPPQSLTSTMESGYPIWVRCLSLG